MRDSGVASATGQSDLQMLHDIKKCYITLTNVTSH